MRSWKDCDLYLHGHFYSEMEKTAVVYFDLFRETWTLLGKAVCPGKGVLVCPGKGALVYPEKEVVVCRVDGSDLRN